MLSHHWVGHDVESDMLIVDGDEKDLRMGMKLIEARATRDGVPQNFCDVTKLRYAEEGILQNLCGRDQAAMALLTIICLICEGNTMYVGTSP